MGRRGTRFPESLLALGSELGIASSSRHVFRSIATPLDDRPNLWGPTLSDQVTRRSASGWAQ